MDLRRELVYLFITISVLLQRNTADREDMYSTPVSSLPAASTPLMTETIFSHSTENPSVDVPNKSSESPLLKCASCNVCVHACKQMRLNVINKFLKQFSGHKLQGTITLHGVTQFRPGEQAFLLKFIALPSLESSKKSKYWQLCLLNEKKVSEIKKIGIESS